MPTSSLLVFTYGSNLCLDRLRRRTPSARPIGIARLPGHDLRWHKVGKDGSGKCDAFASGDPTDGIWGGVVRIDAGELGRLDRAEHLGIGYRAAMVPVALASGTTVQARIYVALRIDPCLRPFDWYHAYVLAGARENGLPADYVRRIERVETCRDPDAERVRRHRHALGQRGS